MSTIEALKIACITPEYIQHNDIGIIFGNDSSSLPVVEAVDIVREPETQEWSVQELFSSR